MIPSSIRAVAGMISAEPNLVEKRPSILIVEDHRDTARVMVRFLELLGYDVEVATSVAEGLAAASRRNFDVLVSDLTLPDGSGLQLGRKLGAKLPAIALSGSVLEEDVEASLSAGFREHLAKPVDFDQLQAAIERIRHRSAASDPAP